ncbi:PREDICTED: putative clathrin assembly protein At1g33340 [Nelumbo nucifera]|uniref:Clathrin assembly protein At1g33340 n=1 Tax=Nelumbo nucifera TaxID=4432 RepID=A0A1U7ZH11_NELNU|nr:PREDICTED: putative clathrin assembly protein At1g33340 [Nelumbo nucifera]
MVVDVQNKLRLALGSVKDHASIGKAMINSHVGFSGIEIAVVRATGHDNTPIDDKHLHEILFLVSNSPGSVPFLAERISHRLDKTRDRNVALKTLLLIHRLLRGGDRYFEQDLRTAHLSGHLQMNTTRWFPRNSSNQSLSFLHSYADFLAERMGWIINQAGKLEPIMFQASEFRFYEEKSIEMVFRRLPKCQVFLDRVLECLPLGIASPSDRLTRAALINILKESFQVYVTFCEGVAALFDSFFDFKNPARVLALDLLKRASLQSYKLFDFFENCKRIIGNKNLEYPSVEIITTDHVLSMEQFLLNSSPSLRPGFLSTKGEMMSPCKGVSNDLTRTSAETYSTAAGASVGNKQGKESREGTDGAFSAPFSCRLETKISKVWVVFDQEGGFQEAHFSQRGGLSTDDHSSNPPTLTRVEEESMGMEIEPGKPCSCYNPFTTCANIKHSTIMEEYCRKVS